VPAPAAYRKQAFAATPIHLDVEMETGTEQGDSVHSRVSYDLLGKVAEHTCLVRRTVASILSGIQPTVFQQFRQNPEQFIAEPSRSSLTTVEQGEHAQCRLLRLQRSHLIAGQDRPDAGRAAGATGAAAHQAERILHQHRGVIEQRC